ncbi:hypothetical protein E2C01_017183 [Portunus trituberculatus]|uniref:Uncharacterized protein n=1 Tax=Portunus trituberculatus TaxID=210409 RepID=A0A5B7DSX1_PORTR|nr:hypothetical protein [Portunus trituberculatus]
MKPPAGPMGCSGGPIAFVGIVPGREYQQHQHHQHQHLVGAAARGSPGRQHLLARVIVMGTWRSDPPPSPPLDGLLARH